MSLNSHSTAQTLLSLRYCARLHAWFHSTMTLDTWGLGPGHGHQLVCVGRDLAPLIWPQLRVRGQGPAQGGLGWAAKPASVCYLA